ncbi:g7994 [Coccomyxa elongata]
MFVASPTTDKLRRLSYLGFLGRAAQSCAPQPWRSTPERWRALMIPPVVVHIVAPLFGQGGEQHLDALLSAAT